MSKIDHYGTLKSRMREPFLREDALMRINDLANRFLLTTEETNELTAIAQQKGLDVMPEDAMGRLTKVEQESNELTLLLADMIGGAM